MSEMPRISDGRWEFEFMPVYRNYRVYQVTTTHRDMPVPRSSTWKKFHDMGIKHRDWVTIRAGESYTFPEIVGPGEITNIWFTATPLVNDNPKKPRDPAKIRLRDLIPIARGFKRIIKYRKFPYLLRKMEIHIYFDDADTPAVKAPLGVFFGCGFGEYKHFMSRYVGMTGGGYVAQFRMPFGKKARVEIVNTTENMVCLAFYGAITYIRYPNKLPDNRAYFHARFRKEYPTTPDKPYLILETEGKGHFLGFVLNAVNLKRKHGFRYLEGNTKFYIDGESEPSLEFTGTEDIFQGAWYYMKTNRGMSEFYADYHGLTVKTGNKWGPIRNTLFGYRHCKTSQYRFFPEGIPFRKSIKVTIHHGEFDEIPANYDSIAYYYLDKP